MANFILELWQSIFTPGPTPTLLVATNATFAALQLVLALLLYATFSVHFLVLSVLCAGLWAAINWFARELKEHQRQEEEKKRRALAARTPPGGPESSSDESETEVEATTTATATARSSTASLRKSPTPAPAQAQPQAQAQAPAAKQPAAASTVVEPVEPRGELKMRSADDEPGQSQGVRSSVSTEDEWEKVSENEKDK